MSDESRLSNEEAKRRARLAISELFLDTTLDDADYLRLRDALRLTRLSLADLDVIYFDEVAPVLHNNLRAPAGVWSGFDPAWLEQEISRRTQRRRFSPLARVRRYLVTRSTLQEWRRLRSMVAV